MSSSTPLRKRKRPWVDRFDGCLLMALAGILFLCAALSTTYAPESDEPKSYTANWVGMGLGALGVCLGAGIVLRPRN